MREHAREHVRTPYGVMCQIVSIKMSQTNITRDQQRLHCFYDLTQMMRKTSHRTDLLTFAIERAIRLTGAQRGLLILTNPADPDSGPWEFARGFAHCSPQHDDAGENQAPSPAIQAIMDDARTHQTTHLIHDLPTDERYAASIASTAAGDAARLPRSLLVLPLLSEAACIGVLTLDHRRSAMFSQEDAAFLQAFVGQAALAVHQAQRHQHQVESLTRLHELSRSVVEVLDVDEVLARIVTEATRFLRVETGSVLLLNEAGTELSFAISISNGQRIVIPTRLRVSEGIAGRVATTGVATSVADVTTDPHWFGEVETGFVTRSMLCVPLRLHGRILGVVQVLNKKDTQGFAATDSALLSTFAASATIAITNARLFHQARQMQHLRQMNTLALALSSTLDLPTILHTGLEQTMQALNAQVGGITLLAQQFDPMGFAGQHSQPGIVRVRQGIAAQPDQATRQERLMDASLDYVRHTPIAEPLVIDATASNGAVLPSTLPTDLAPAACVAAGVERLALVPVQMGGTPCGVLVVMRSAPSPYSADDLSLLSNSGRILDLAVQNATHYTQAHAQAHRLRYLNQIGGMLTRSLDLSHVLKVIIEGVNALLQTERTSVFLVDDETHELVLRYTNEGPTDIRLPPPWQGVAGWVATHDSATIVNDPSSDGRHLRQVAQEIGYEASSLLCVPLRLENRVIGVVEALNKTDGHHFTPYHQELLSELTQWAAIAIHNARLFAERVRAYQDLAAEQQRRIAAETRGAMAAVVLDMAHTMNNIIGAIRVWALTLEHDLPVRVAGESRAACSQHIRHIRQNAEEAIDLIRTMRGPLEQATIEAIDMHRCLERTLASCWLPDTVQVHTDYSSDLPLVRANGARLEAVFQNLIANSIQAFEQEVGDIFLTTGTTDDGWGVVTIRDTGPGIAPEIQDQLFTPGVSNKAGRLGIGLWLVETFISQFGGTIGWHSDAGSGTTFTIRLPPFTPTDPAELSSSSSSEQ